MKYRAGALLAVAAMLGACAGPRPLPADAGHVNAADPAGISVNASMDSARDIVLAVANPLDPPATRAGSSLLGYAPAGYGAGQRAVALLAALKQSYGLRQVAGWPIKPLNLYCVVLEPPPGTDRDALLKTLASDARVELAQPLQNFSVYASAPASNAHQYNDPYVNLQRGFVETDAALAHRATQGEAVHVAVVDTGVDTTHQDLQGRVGEVHNLVDDDARAFEGDHHGTEVAGVIAADGDNRQGIVGIAPRAVLSVYKACWYPPASMAARCNSFTLAKALAAIVNTNDRIVNLSLGGPADPLLDRLLAQLLGQGRIVVAALPPDGSLDGFPDRAKGVLVVRTSAADAPPPGVLSAPGNDILTTQPNGGYDFTSGSSMAAAHVSGIAALLLSLSPTLSAADMRELLLHSSKLSGGMLQVNAAAAIDALRSRKAAR